MRKYEKKLSILYSGIKERRKNI